MTAPDDNDARDEKRGVPADGVDAATLLEYLEQHDGDTIDGLATAAGVTEDRIRELVLTLKNRGQVRIEPRQGDVLVQPLTGEDLRADGGLRGLLDRVGGADERVSLTERQVYHVLSSQRRRQVLRLLAGSYDVDDPTYLEVRDLAESLARTETADPTKAEVHSCYVSLSQVHLPVLDSLELVEYHERVGKLRGSRDAVLLASLMEDVAALADGPATPDDRDATPGGERGDS